MHDGRFELLTGEGPAAVAVVRVSGAGAEAFVARHVRRAGRSAARWAAGDVGRATLLDERGDELDEILVSMHVEAPEADVRLHLHGSPAVVRRVCELARQAGLSAGDATGLWRAANRIEADAWELLPRMTTAAGAEWLCRQIGLLGGAVERLLRAGDDELIALACEALPRWRAAGRLADAYAAGCRVAIVGPPNAGKSTLFNALTGQEAAVVSAAPGTTRDWLEARGEIGGFPVAWLDTAGIRPTADALERESIARTRRVMEGADAVIFVLDASETARPVRDAFADEYRDWKPTLVALNKTDVGGRNERLGEELRGVWPAPVLEISAEQRTGLDRLGEALLTGLGWSAFEPDVPAAFSIRQRECVSAAEASSEPAAVRSRLGALLG